MGDEEWATADEAIYKVFGDKFAISRKLVVQEGLFRITEPAVLSNEKFFKVRDVIRKGEKDIIADVHDNDKPKIVQK